MGRQMGTAQTQNWTVPIVEMDRLELIGLLKAMHCSFELDFTEEYLDHLSLDYLRHILTAASLHEQTSAKKHAQ